MNLILPQKIYGGSKSKIDFVKTWKIFNVIFEISSYKYNETDTYFPFANIFIYLEVFYILINFLIICIFRVINVMI